MKLFVLITIYCCLRSNNGEDNNNILGAEFIDAEEFEYTKDIPLEKKLWVGRTFGAVSYTHLDVYKRQVHNEA